MRRTAPTKQRADITSPTPEDKRCTSADAELFTLSICHNSAALVEVSFSENFIVFKYRLPGIKINALLKEI